MVTYQTNNTIPPEMLQTFSKFALELSRSYGKFQNNGKSEECRQGAYGLLERAKTAKTISDGDLPSIEQKPGLELKLERKDF